MTETERLIAEFEARGGKIYHAEPGERALENGSFVRVNECNSPIKMTIAEIKEKGRKGAQANKLRNAMLLPVHMNRQSDNRQGSNKHANIHPTKSGKHHVVVAGIPCGTYADEKEAIQVRQKKREALKMHFIPEDK